MRSDEWGDRCPRWAGVRSVLTVVADVPVHYLAGDPTAHVVDDAPSRVTGLVLAAPTLPWRRTSRYDAIAWHRVDRAAPRSPSACRQLDRVTAPVLLL